MKRIILVLILLIFVNGCNQIDLCKEIEKSMKQNSTSLDKIECREQKQDICECIVLEKDLEFSFKVNLRSGKISETTKNVTTGRIIEINESINNNIIKTKESVTKDKCIESFKKAFDEEGFYIINSLEECKGKYYCDTEKGIVEAQWTPQGYWCDTNVIDAKPFEYGDLFYERRKANEWEGERRDSFYGPNGPYATYGKCPSGKYTMIQTDNKDYCYNKEIGKWQLK